MSRSSGIVSQIQRRRAERKKPKVNSKLVRVSVDESQRGSIASASENKPPPITLQKTGGRNSLSLFFSIGLHVSLALLLGFIYIKDRISADQEKVSAEIFSADKFNLTVRPPHTILKPPTFEAGQPDVEVRIKTTVKTDTNILNTTDDGFTLPSNDGTDFTLETPGLNAGPRIFTNPRKVPGPVQTETSPIPEIERPPQAPPFTSKFDEFDPDTEGPRVPPIPTPDGDTDPKIKESVKPTYPKNAKRAEKEGTVKLQVTIGTDGIPKNIVALTKLGFGLEDAAIAALKKWRFIPGKKKGKDAEMTVNIPFKFKLDE